MHSQSSNRSRAGFTQAGTEEGERLERYADEENDEVAHVLRIVLFNAALRRKKMNVQIAAGKVELKVARTTQWRESWCRSC